jgi:hypothetical protein
MTKLNKILIGVALTALLGAGCSLDTPAPVELDYTLAGAEYFEDYVAIGNSLTAGYMDGGLIGYTVDKAGPGYGQINSYPQLLASAMGYAPGSFYQPYIAFPGIGSSDTGDPALIAGVLRFDGAGISLAGATTAASVASLAIAALYPLPYNNLGVPGATTLDVTNALDSSTSQSPGNSFFDLILRNPDFGNVSMINQAIAMGPKIMTCWIGNNDILGGATSGSPVLGVNITPAVAFTPMYQGILDQLTTGVAERHGYTPMIVVGNVPDIASAPYFVPKALFDMLAGGAIPTVEDAVYVRFPALGFLDSDDAVLPLPAEWTLDAAEVAVVNTAVTDINAAIAAEVAARDNVYLYDANAVLAGLDSGTEAAHFIALVGGGLDVETAAATTYFSLDGIHPNNRGYALVANGMIDVINTALGTELAQIPLAAITWDPTYGIPMGGKADGPLLTPAAAHAMDAVFR